MPITNINRRLGRWAEFFEGQFNWPAAPVTLVRLSCPPWSMTTDPPNEAEARKELQFYKSPDPDDLPPALSKDGGDFLIKELTTLFTNAVVITGTSAKRTSCEIVCSLDVIKPFLISIRSNIRSDNEISGLVFEIEQHTNQKMGKNTVS
ncbi:unnamed protein product [Schistosoma curassoni]|uniref:Uncharacterized protein n=1 Tax=Schistosoma curassoni TaxID=6186 RepID=A0A183K9F0_9TREM|nr:unnamed protein product [Schistosoma curassoni]